MGKEGMVEQEVETAGGDSTVEELKMKRKMVTRTWDTIKPHSWNFVKGQLSSVLKRTMDQHHSRTCGVSGAGDSGWDPRIVLAKCLLVMLMLVCGRESSDLSSPHLCPRWMVNACHIALLYRGSAHHEKSCVCFQTKMLIDSTNMRKSFNLTSVFKLTQTS